MKKSVEDSAYGNPHRFVARRVRIDKRFVLKGERAGNILLVLEEPFSHTAADYYNVV